jgi:hypothetical protein
MKSIIFNKKDLKKIPELIKTHVIDPKLHEFADKNTIYQFLLNNEEIKNIIHRSSQNIIEMESVFEEEVTNISKMNLKKSKLNSTQDVQMICSRDMIEFENVLLARQAVKKYIINFYIVFGRKEETVSIRVN